MLPGLRRRRSRRSSRRAGIPASLAAASAVAMIAIAAATSMVGAESAAPTAPAASPDRSAVPSAPGSSTIPRLGPSWPPGRTLRVPSQFADLNAAIRASQPGDVILLAPGTYPGGIHVADDRPGITIRGEDRNAVVFDGDDRRPSAIEVSADGVSVENVSAHDFTANGFMWDKVDGFAGRYLTVWNVGLNGIATVASRDGVIEDSYVSAAADTAISIVDCHPCDTTVRRVTATLSALGFAGTNAGGDLAVEDSRFLLNGVGMLVGSFDVGPQPLPQRDAVLQRNDIAGTGTVVTPRTAPLAGFHGVGIGIAGGQSNVVEDNDVRGSARYGIAVFTAIDRTTSWYPSRNQVTGNQVFDSGIADLALAGGFGQQNCFQDNEAARALPARIANACSSFGTSDAKVEGDLSKAPHDLLEGLPEPPHYSDMDPPPAQPTMPTSVPVATPTAVPTRAASAVPFPSQRPVAASGENVVLAASVLIVALFSVVILLVAFRVVPRRR